MPILEIGCLYKECAEKQWQTWIRHYRYKPCKKTELLKLEDVAALLGIGLQDVLNKGSIQGQRAFWVFKFKAELTELNLDGTVSRQCDYYVYPKEVFLAHRDKVEKQARKEKSGDT